MKTVGKKKLQDKIKQTDVRRRKRKYIIPSDNNSTSFPALPCDIIEKILSHLPIKPLIRFLCQSKSLYSLRQDPNFVEMHLNNSLQRSPRFILRDVSFGPVQGNLPLQENDLIPSLYLVDEEKRKWKSTEIPVSDIYKWPRYQKIVASCNGLLCIMCEDYCKPGSRYGPIIIYNPVTRESMTLPSNIETIRPWIAFGYDETRHQYKVVILDYSFSGRTMRVFAMTLGESCWRETNIPYDCFKVITLPRTGKTSTFFNGSFYWVIRMTDGNGDGDRHGYKILAMDMLSEKFEMINFIDYSLPHGRHYICGAPEHFYLVNMAKNLALVVYNCSKKQMQIWVMVEKGIWVQQSKHCMLSFLDRHRKRGKEDFDCRVESIAADGSLLLEYYDEEISGYYTLYDQARHFLVRFKPTDKRKFDLNFLSNIEKVPTEFDVISFVPSFVSLKF